MDISRGSCFRRVEIGVGIHPDHTQFLVLCRAADGPHRQTVIAAQHKRKPAALNGCCHRTRNAPPHGDDAIDVFEFGAGSSTAYWSKKVASVTSVEFDSSWYKTIAQLKLPNVEIKLCEDGGLYPEKITVLVKFRNIAIHVIYT